MQAHDTKQEKVPKEPDGRARSSSPPSGDNPPPDDTGERGEVEYNDLFGTPALAGDSGEQEDVDPFKGAAGDPPAAPSLPFTAYPPKRELYEAAFRAAYKYPDALMLVMEGVRKGLKRGKEAAQRAGGQIR